MRDPRTRFTLVFSLLLAAALASSALAQTTTATIRGKVTDQSGGSLAGVEINAVSTQTGFVHTTTSRSDGSFLLAGLTPGPYNIVVASPGFEPKSQDLTVLVGQTLDLTFRLAPEVVHTEEITVIGNVPVEMETHEIVTNITREQIERLPQGNRNFLGFAGLAPGVRYLEFTDNGEKKQFRAGAQTGNATNVFIDGVSFKNDVLEGGVVGQDSSRGNPFPQNAVQEFRVLTQNYTAEYQKASSAVITAVTKSGSNDMSGEVFAFFQDKDLVAQDDFAAARNEPKPTYERLQTGLSIGGPIIRDRMHYFFSYEGNQQDRANRVAIGGGATPAQRPLFTQYEGVFTSPFESDLFFGKLSYQPSAGHLFDLSANLRTEEDIRGFGGEFSIEAAENIKNDVFGAVLRHQMTGNTWLNEASLSYQDYDWNPVALNPDQVGFQYFGIIRIGGRDTTQQFNQKRTSLRDDITFSGWEWRGNHTLKVGGNLDFLDYKVRKEQFGNPLYQFRNEDIAAGFPFQALYGLGNPDLSGDNTQFGIYAQDEWSATDHLTLNLGVRWDYEADMIGTDYVTPAVIREKFAPFVDDDTYFTDGDDREPITNMFQPRLGATYDVFDNGKTIVFGGVGRYYDRIPYTYTLDERFRLQYAVGTFRFSSDGLPRDGNPTVVFRPEYLTEAGLQQLLATGTTGRPEVFLIENDTEAPYSDQWNIGVRQSFGGFIAGLSYGSVRSYNGFTFIRGDLNSEGNCCVTLVPEYDRLILSSDDIKTWTDAIYLTLDRPFTRDSRWGAHLSYTHTDAEQIGGDLFSLDFRTVEDYPKYPSNLPVNRLVANAQFGLPWEIGLSTILTYESGIRYHIDDATLGYGPGKQVLHRNAGEGDDFQSIDLRLEKDFRIAGQYGIGVIAEAFNIADHENYGCYDGFIPFQAVNARFGQPGCLVEPGRRLQYGVRFTF